MKTTTVKMKQEKETKNTYRYSEVEIKGQPMVLNTLYIQKWLDPPEEITVTITGE